MGEFTIIAYLIGENKYKQLLFKQYDKIDVIKEYRSLLNNHHTLKEFVIVMLNNEYKILTAWALGTPIKLIEAAKIALNTFEKGDDLFIDDKLKLVNLFGSQIYTEIIDEAKIKKLLPEDYTDFNYKPLTDSVTDSTTVPTDVCTD